MDPATRQELPHGALAGDYCVDRCVSKGGFGIVYRATCRGESFYVKEFMPKQISQREGVRVLPIDPESVRHFQVGLECFRENALALLELRHRNIVTVYDVFEANDTAYMVMRPEDGKTFADLVADDPRYFSEDVMREHFLQVIDGLYEAHSLRMLHLDVKPANIILRRDGTPVLIDFNGSRSAMSAVYRTKLRSYTPGYSPPEQYAHGQISAAADIYGVGATIYNCATGDVLPDAMQRRTGDAIAFTGNNAAKRFGHPFLDLIRWCAELTPADRPASLADLYNALLETRPRHAIHYASR